MEIENWLWTLDAEQCMAIEFELLILPFQLDWQFNLECRLARFGCDFDLAAMFMCDDVVRDMET